MLVAIAFPLVALAVVIIANVLSGIAEVKTKGTSVSRRDNDHPKR